MKKDKSVIALVITPPPPPTPPPPIKALVAGNFYRDLRTGKLVFAASTSGEGTDVEMLGAYPAATTPVVGIGSGGTWNGFALQGLFGSPDDYEVVDVEITVKPRS